MVGVLALSIAATALGGAAAGWAAVLPGGAAAVQLLAPVDPARD